MNSQNKTFLVTGASGYIGSHMCYELRQTYPNCRIVGVDKAQKRKLIHLYDRFICNDLARSNFMIMDRENIDCVFHFAAYASVPEGEDNKYMYYQNNLMSSLRLIDEVIFNNVRNFIFSSTCAVYGDVKGSISEKQPKNPQSVYAKTKSIIEDILYAAEENNDLNVAVLRYFNAAGRNMEGNLYEEHNPETHLIPNLMTKDVVEVFGTNFDTPDGTAVRDYIHVVDICQAHIRAYEYMESKNKGITCNIGTGIGYSVLQIIDLVKQIKDIKVEFHDRRRGDVDRLVSDITLMKNELTFMPRHDIVSIIKSMEKHTDGIRSC